VLASETDTRQIHRVAVFSLSLKYRANKLECFPLASKTLQPSLTFVGNTQTYPN
jgi:hypothetical protein